MAYAWPFKYVSRDFVGYAAYDMSVIKVKPDWYLNEEIWPKIHMPI